MALQNGGTDRARVDALGLGLVQSRARRRQRTHRRRACGRALVHPVYWHQHQLFCAKYLFEQRSAGVKLGVLISPSVDGEFGAIIVRSLGGEVIRGSSTHTGARALRDYYQALVHEGISPVIAPDGPRGPPWKFKPGALLLAQLSQRPVLPLSYCASRAWKISWDRFVIPKIGARIVIAVGEPVYVAKGLDAAGLERLQADMEQRLGCYSNRRRRRWGAVRAQRLCESAIYRSPINTIA